MIKRHKTMMLWTALVTTLALGCGDSKKSKDKQASSQQAPAAQTATQEQPKEPATLAPVNTGDAKAALPKETATCLTSEGCEGEKPTEEPKPCADKLVAALNPATKEFATNLCKNGFLPIQDAITEIFKTATPLSNFCTQEAGELKISIQGVDAVVPYKNGCEKSILKNLGFKRISSSN
jgi:hypothetical protein